MWPSGRDGRSDVACRVPRVACGHRGETDTVAVTVCRCGSVGTGECSGLVAGVWSKSWANGSWL